MNRFMMALMGLAVSGVATQADAALINAGGNVTDVSGALAIFPVSNASDGIASLGSSAWVSTNNSSPSYFDDVAAVNPVLDFDLGSDSVLDAVRIYGYNSRLPQHSVSTFNISFATEADGPAGFGTAINLGTSGPLAGDTVFEDIAFAGTTARYVRIEVTGNYGGDRVGGTDFQFNSNPVPEPGSLALLGLSSMFMLRRRRS